MLILSDLHLNNFKQWSTIAEGFNTRLLDQISVIKYVTHLIEEHKVENVVFLGDMIHSYSDSWAKVVTGAVAYALKSWSRQAQVYVLVGNHDIYRGMHIFDSYTDIRNVHIVAHPITGLHLEGHTVDLIPWGYGIPEEKSEVLMAHMDILNARYNAVGGYSTTGVPSTDLKGYKYVFLGHFHEAQYLDVPGATYATYIGSIMQTDLGLSDGPRGALLFNGSSIVREDVPSPKLHAVEVATQHEADAIVRRIEGGDYWRVTVTDPSIELPQFDHRVQVEYDIKPTMDSRLEEKEGEELKDTVKRYIEQANTKVDKELILKLLDEVME